MHTTSLIVFDTYSDRCATKPPAVSEWRH